MCVRVCSDVDLVHDVDLIHTHLFRTMNRTMVIGVRGLHHRGLRRKLVDVKIADTVLIRITRLRVSQKKYVGWGRVFSFVSKNWLCSRFT